MALDKPGNPVCVVTTTAKDGPALHGAHYGNAIVRHGDRNEAVTADGKRHAL